MLESKKHTELENYSNKDDISNTKECNEKKVCFNVSQAYSKLGLNGKGDETNFTKMKEMFKKGVSKDDDEYIYNLANIYLNGVGIEKDITKAIQLLELSALRNNSLAYLNLGFIYLKGDEVEQDIAKAFLYFQASSRLGNETAKEMMDKFSLIFSILI